MDIDLEQLTVVSNEADGQYEIHYDGHLAVLAYLLAGDRVVLVHTGVPPALERHGLAAVLTRHALEDARARGFGVVPSCPYVRSYLLQHPEYADLVVATGD